MSEDEDPGPEWLGSWECHGCGEERPDPKIAVATSPVDFAGGAAGQVRLRYCNDRPECEVTVRAKADDTARTLASASAWRGAGGSVTDA